jgi:hypothetical protein
MNSSSKKSRSLLIPVLVLTVLAVGISWFFYNHARQSPGSLIMTSQSPADPTPAFPTTGKTLETPSSAAETQESAIKEESVPASFTALPTQENLLKAIDTVSKFYQHLDQQGYILARHLNTPSQIYFTQLVQKALDTPPSVIRETDNLLTILKNAAHFFRILGKDNIQLVKEVLNRENTRIEELLASYYVLITQPELPGNDLTPKIPDTVLYEYASFFLDTMGGRLYLSRRDPLTRMLVTYYAIQIIHQANLHDKNSIGIQLQPAINLLTTEIETGGNHLRFKEAYLDALYDLKEKYQ